MVLCCIVKGSDGDIALVSICVSACLSFFLSVCVCVCVCVSICVCLSVCPLLTWWCLGS